MPIYEYECPLHNRIEVYFPRVNNHDWIWCPECIEDINLMNSQRSTYRAVGEPTHTYTYVEPNKAERVWSCCTMKPDKYWNGQTSVMGHYVTSAKEAKIIMGNLEPATRDNIEWSSKRKEKAKEERIQKNQEDLNEFLNEELRGVDDTTFKPDSHETVESYQQANYLKNGGLSYELKD